MAEEEVVALPPEAAASPFPSEHKRKFEDVEPEAPETVTEPTTTHQESAEPDSADDVVASDSSEAKRPRLDDNDNDKPDGLASENGFKSENSAEPAKEEENNGLEEQKEGNERTKDIQSPPEELQEKTEQPSEENNETGDTQPVSVENSEGDLAQEHSKEENLQPSREFPPNAHGTMTRRMEVPNNKVGVLIGKAGDTIRSLQYNSGAKIQITRDADADPHSTTRPVEVIGDLASIEKAEILIKAVIAEADAGGSPSLVARGLATAQAVGVSEQIEMQVPNEKVGLIIGKSGETIKGLQSRSGARIQLIPQHLPEGDESQERTVRISGDRKQIEMARVMIKDVMNQTLRPSSLSSGLHQQAYRPRGPPGPGHWGPQGPPMSYDYHQRGPYPSQNPRYQPPNYGGYPSQQMASRSNFGSGWEHRPPPQSGGYDYYGGQGGHLSSHPVPAPSHMPGHAPGPSPATVGPPPSQVNYNYGQPQAPDYGHPAPYSQTAPPQQSYGHGYDEQKYDNHAPTQHPYGGHGSSQAVYSQAGTQQGYAPQQQYGKPTSYGMPPQVPPTQSYGPPWASQPGDVPYQTSAQSYGSNVPTQQYPYVSSGPMQQTYAPYGSASAADGYNQQPPASGPGYAQQVTQPATGYGQPGGQQTPGYGQVASAGGYGAYPSTQQGYTEQTASNSTGYGYQAAQDTAYSTGPGSAYGAPTSVQPNYAQPAPTQPSYDQSGSQPGGYGAAAPAAAPAAYGKTLSPQPGYTQYDANQMYAAPR